MTKRSLVKRFHKIVTNRKGNGDCSASILPGKYAETASQHAYRDSWYRYCDHNNILRVTLYELRHTYVSINDEMSDGLKKQAVGHSQSMDTEGVYRKKPVISSVSPNIATIPSRRSSVFDQKCVLHRVLSN